MRFIWTMPHITIENMMYTDSFRFTPRCPSVDIGNLWIISIRPGGCWLLLYKPCGCASSGPGTWRGHVFFFPRPKKWRRKSPRTFVNEHSDVESYMFFWRDFHGFSGIFKSQFLSSGFEGSIFLDQHSYPKTRQRCLRNMEDLNEKLEAFS